MEPKAMEAMHRRMEKMHKKSMESPKEEMDESKKMKDDMPSGHDKDMNDKSTSTKKSDSFGKWLNNKKK